MKKLNKLVVAFGAAILFASTAMIGGAQAYSVNNTYQLGVNEGSNQRTNNRLVIAHETGTYAPAVNNAAYMKRTWNTNYAYTQYVVGDGGQVYRIGADGYVSWGAGTWGNANAPVQVELARTTNDAQFKVDYAVYVNLLRDSAKKFGISTNLDTGYGIVTHKWITDNVWGDHQDPYGYLASHGITKAQFAQDLKTGLPENGSGTNTAPINPVKPTPNEWAENWHFTNGDQPIQARRGTPSLSAPYAGKLPVWTTIYYDRVAVRDGYVWCHWTTNNGDSVWMPVHPVGTANNVWVSFD
ncbi:SH3 domain-containing protein [Latilactobacillus curvatus]|uniref:SH3 domain-containing protein n=1 Tax=Latilactobacillus curvatus TaxID=28038 RepID=UPI002073A7F0|nr:N-acetylmuramoyl-L-alanine amidase [Latilactobacillus curvatus]MCM6843521.1 SH3 domain-containing protein [Latilactobacillus curvatus]MCM6861585.1 SH3 domain-containing protein [Latilactobacillus curvatus]MCM6868884.1 SH3 domain-containing protein [Latilactobacillus curvatus]